MAPSAGKTSKETFLRKTTFSNGRQPNLIAIDENDAPTQEKARQANLHIEAEARNIKNFTNVEAEHNTMNELMKSILARLENKE